MRRASTTVSDGRVCEDGDQIAVPAGASWQLYQLNSDAYPTCDKTALAEYNLAQSLPRVARLAVMGRGRVYPIGALSESPHSTPPGLGR